LKIIGEYMRDLLRQFFGERSKDVLIIHEDGQDWVLVKDICSLIGAHSEYHAVGDQCSYPELDLNEADKRMFWVRGVHRKCPVWFVTESGFWKIIGRSHAPWALTFRAALFTDTIPRMYR
jgi:prophage antirepressor-like protein